MTDPVLLEGLESPAEPWPDDPGRHPPGGRRYRCHRPRCLPAPAPKQVRRKGRKGWSPTRDRYRQLLRRAPLSLLPAKHRIVLEILIDQYEAGPALADVTNLRQRRLVEQIAHRFEAGEPWGYRLRTIQTILRELTEWGWLSIEDIDLPGTGFQGNSYRFLVPAGVAGLWREIIQTSESAYERVRGASKAAERAALLAEQAAAWAAYVEGTDEDFSEDLNDPLESLSDDSEPDDEDLEAADEDLVSDDADPERAEEIRTLIQRSLLHSGRRRRAPGQSGAAGEPAAPP